MTSIDWQPSTAMMAALIHDDGRKLALTINCVGEGGWTAGAIECGPEAKTAADALASHAHKLIGTYDDPASAIFAAEDFGRGWLGPGVRAPLCLCEEIPAGGPPA